MTEFSELLRYKVKKVQVASLAQYCNLDRSNLYKIINGNRNPSSLEQVERMADFMGLPPSERDEFLEAYHITMIGKDKYYSRKSVMNYILDCSNLCANDRTTSLLSQNHTCQDRDSYGICTPLTGDNEIRHMITYILQKELKCAKRRIQVAAQPTWTYLFDLLQSMGYKDSELVIEHILCFSNNSDVYQYNKQNYNVNCLQKISKFYHCACNYTPYYYYDNIESHFENLSCFSYMVLTTEYVLCCSSDIKYGILFHDPHMSELFNEVFEEHKRHAKILIHKIDSDITQYINLVQECFGISLESEPCIAALLDPTYVNQLISPSLQNRDKLIQDINNHIKNLEGKLKKLKESGFSFNFTLKGIQYFMETGRCLAYPPEIYTTVPDSTRLKILRQLKKKADNEFFRLIIGELEQMPLTMHIMMSKTCGYILTQDYNKQLIYLRLEDKSLLKAFYDFIENLESEGYLATVEQTSKTLQDLLIYYESQKT